MEMEKDFSERLLAHRVNGVTEFYGGPHETTIDLTRQLHALLVYIGAAIADPETGATLDERPIDSLNREIVTGAFEALAKMAALANFFANEIKPRS